MAKLESADEFIANVKANKYENKVNAQRGAGRTRLSDKEKEKIFAYLDQHFGEGGTTAAPKAAKPGKVGKKRVAKKVAKKKASKKVTARPAAPAEAAAPEQTASPVAKTGKKKKKVSKKAAPAAAKPPPGTLPISPSEVNSVAGVFEVIDGTVTKSVSIIKALQQADELSKSGDITKGVETVKLALEEAARLLHKSVVAPLTHIGAQADPEVAARLEQVVAASAPLVAHQESYTHPPVEGLPS
jgi:hypothetical protein